MRDLVPFRPCHHYARPTRRSGPFCGCESVLIKQQLLILNRSRQRSPNLRSSDRLVAGLCALLIRPVRLIRSSIVLKPSTLLSLHRGTETIACSSHSPGPHGPFFLSQQAWLCIA